MSRILYGQPIPQMIAEIILLPFVLSLVVESFIPRDEWKRRFWLVLLIISLYGILNQTLFNRTPEIRSGLVSPPFILIWSAVFHRKEIVRSLLLNILLFEPFGAASVNFLTQKHSIWLRIISAFFCGLALSVGLEMCQFSFSLGNAEADDVICNTLGTFIGSLSLPIKAFWASKRNAKEDNQKREKRGKKAEGL